MAVSTLPRSRWAVLLLALFCVLGTAAARCAVPNATGNTPPPTHPMAAVGCARESCGVTLSRNTTSVLAHRLTDGSTTDAVVAVLAGEAACLLITRHFLTHVICTAGTSVAAYRLAHALRRAAAANGCLRMGFRKPAANGDWVPVFAVTDATARCHS